MPRKTPNQQDKYDNLLLNVVQNIDDKTDELTKEVVKQGEELKSNTRETVLLKKEVRETNGSVQTLKAEVIGIKKVVFPEVPVKAKDLDEWYQDPKVLGLLKLAGGIILIMLTIYAGLKRIPIPGL